MAHLSKKINPDAPKVLFVGPYPPPYSGPELGMKQFLESELTSQFRIRFVKTNFRSTNEDKGKAGMSAVLWTAIFYLRLIGSLAGFRPHAVYYPVTATALGWAARDAPCIVLCRLFGARVVIHLRGGHLRLNLRSFGRFVRSMVRYACATVSAALVQAQCLRDQFRGLVPEERIHVLHQAIDTAEYNAPPPGEGDSKQVLFLGNLSYTKGYCDLVRAIPIVAASIPGVKFVFCGSIVEGDGGVLYDQTSGRELRSESPRAVHESALKSSYCRNYEWRGVVFGEEKMRLLHSSAVVALPSYSEGFSRALLEAMSVGKPVVCTPVGAHREFIIDGVNGLLVAPGDVEKLAEALVAVLSNDDLRATLGRNNYRYTRENFDISRVAQRLGAYIVEGIDGEP